MKGFDDLTPAERKKLSDTLFAKYERGEATEAEQLDCAVLRQMMVRGSTEAQTRIHLVGTLRDRIQARRDFLDSDG